VNPLQQLIAAGQSVWLDFIRRDWLEDGRLAKLIAAGELRGVTSNPTIFDQAVQKSDLYTPDLRQMAQAGRAPEAIMDSLTISDIRHATDLFLPVYESTNGGDGFVSIEVSPVLARDTDQTLSEARRLWTSVNRPNLMVKIPATREGIPAIEQALAEGININITLIFSLDRYQEVMEAYLKALERRVEQGASIDHVASVASFFVSRVDSEVDARLDKMLRSEGPEAEKAALLRGKAAIANAKLAYTQFRASFNGARFARLRNAGGRLQRPLWASTSTKDPAYPDTYYVLNLIGPDTVNTLPPETLDAFRDHGKVEATLDRDLSASMAQLEALEAIGVSMADVTAKLEKGGVDKFSASHHSLLETIRKRSAELRPEVGPLLEPLQNELRQLDQEAVGRRVWERDPSLWARDEAAAREVSQRLGWLDLPETMPLSLGEIQASVDEIRSAGFDRVVLLGMGGSSLAAEVMARMFPGRRGLDLMVLDSTHPLAVTKATRRSPAGRTFFVAASKSGTTVEVQTLLEHFWGHVEERRGHQPGASFAAITDPRSPLESLALTRRFRAVFPAPEAVGGRFSALSVFGLVPAMLAGVDARWLLRGATHMQRQCRGDIPTELNPALFLGAALAAGAAVGRDKVTIVADEPYAAFGPWIEQLLAESSGKAGKGLVPVVGEDPGPASEYGSDRLLVYLRTAGKHDAAMKACVGAGVPVVILEVGRGEAGLGAEFFRWEMAVAVACHRMGVNAFDQPDVQSAKDRTTAILNKPAGKGRLERGPVLWTKSGAKLHGDAGGGSQPSRGELVDAMAWVLGRARAKDAVAVLAFGPQGERGERLFQKARQAIRSGRRLATAFGWGPRYLHSTGQLQKGGSDRCVLLLITHDPDVDVPIPGTGLTFGKLIQAQAVGDFTALQERGRRVFLLHLRSADELPKVAQALMEAARARRTRS
jgi:transaldolase/glucose-6-phosphate isomerase